MVVAALQSGDLSRGVGFGTYRTGLSPQPTTRHLLHVWMGVQLNYPRLTYPHTCSHTCSRALIIGALAPPIID
jgi:hypothetical protein